MICKMKLYISILFIFVILEESIEADSDDGFQYKEVPEDDDYSVSG